MSTIKYYLKIPKKTKTSIKILCETRELDFKTIKQEIYTSE